MAKYDEIRIDQLLSRLVKEAKSGPQVPVEKEPCLNKDSQALRDEAIRQRLGIEGKVIRVFKRKAQAPVREAKSRGWLFKEVMKRERLEN